MPDGWSLEQFRGAAQPAPAGGMSFDDFKEEADAPAQQNAPKAAAPVAAVVRAPKVAQPSAPVGGGDEDWGQEAKPIIGKILGGLKTIAGAPKAVAGMAEAGTEMLTNFFAAVPAIPVGIYNAVKEKDPQAFVSAFQGVQDKLTEHAVTDEGKAMIHAMGQLVEAQEKGVDWTIDTTGLDKYPAAAAVVKGALMVAPMLLGLRRGKGGVKAEAEPKVEAVEVVAKREPPLGDTAKTEVGPTETFPQTRLPEEMAAKAGEPGLSMDHQSATEAANRVPLWEMSEKELESLKASEQKYYDAIEREVIKKNLGEKGLAEYESVGRRKKERLLESLPVADYDKTAGIGRPHPAPDTIGEYQNARTRFDTESPEAMGRSLRWDITRLGDAPLDPLAMNYEQRLAYTTMRGAMEYAAEKGWDPKVISKAAISSAAARFGEAADAEFMLQRYMKPAGSAPEVPKLADPEHPYEGGGTLELGAGPFPTKQAMDALLGKAGEQREAFNPIRDKMQGGIFDWERQGASIGHELRETVPKPADREAITKALQFGDTSALSPEQLAGMERGQAILSKMGDWLVALDKIGEKLDRYVPQIWDLSDPKTKKTIEAWENAQGRTLGPTSILDRVLGGGGTGGNPFTRERKIPTYEEGIKLGLKPKNLDYAALVETYVKKTAQTIETAKALRSLRNLKGEDGTPMAVLKHDAPSGYRDAGIEGYRVHPDIAPAVKVLLEADKPSTPGRALQVLSYATKRIAFSFSGFHAKSLYEGFMGSGGNPVRPMAAIDAALKAYREGGFGDTLHKLVETGDLKIGAPLEDIMGRDMYLEVFNRAEQTMDRLKLGKPVAIARGADNLLQKFTWDYIHTGFKIDTALRKYEIELTRNLTRKNPLTEEQILKSVGKYTNGVYGGLNWERMLDAFDRPWARQIMSELLNKSGRRWLQTGLIAPDWLISTVSTWTNALAPGRANMVRRQLAMRYLALSAMYMTLIGNGLQQVLTGHWMFDNEPKGKDKSWGAQLKAKTEIQLPDGRTMQLSKHFTEVPHLAADPVQFGMNKLGFVPREVATQALNQKYLSRKGSPPITKESDTTGQWWLKRGAHLGENFVPLTAKTGGLGGMVGLPIHGRTKAEIEKANQEKEAKKLENKLNRALNPNKLQRKLDKALGQ